MKNTSILIIILLLINFFGNEAVCENMSIKELSEEIRHLKANMKRMEKIYKSRIEDLETKIEGINIEEPGKENDVSDIRQKALQAIGGKGKLKKTENLNNVVFKSRGIGLQALNPEISATGDFVSYYRSNRDRREHSDIFFRDIALHIESYLDPYTKFKCAFPIVEGAGVPDLGEGYIIRYGFWNNVDLTIGKFRQQFGVINRWHKHALDQVDFPLALRKIFGGGGLNQTGISFDWHIPVDGSVSHSLTYQATKGKNGMIFGGNSLGQLSHLLKYKNFRELSKDSYFEFGISALAGENDRWATLAGTIENRLNSRVYGFDMTYLWEPTAKMRYENLEIRSEFYWVDMDIVKPDGSGTDSVKPFGAYTTIQRKVSRTLDLGIRFDYYRGSEKLYDYNGFAYNSLDPHSTSICPYLTYHQSPFVRYRLEFDHIDNHNNGLSDDNYAYFQVIWAAGPHLHERY